MTPQQAIIGMQELRTRTLEIQRRVFGQVKSANGPTYLLNRADALALNELLTELLDLARVAEIIVEGPPEQLQERCAAFLAEA